jgi:predicted Fe-Mo cluster-binding NifX family protein
MRGSNVRSRLVRRNDNITLICIPTLNEGGFLADISMHFGKTPFITFIELKDGKIEEINVRQNIGKHNGGHKTPAEIILSSGADVLICGNLGQKAISMLRENGIDVFSGASGQVKDAYNQWKHGDLSTTDVSSCFERGC